VGERRGGLGGDRRSGGGFVRTVRLLTVKMVCLLAWDVGSLESEWKIILDCWSVGHRAEDLAMRLCSLSTFSFAFSISTLPSVLFLTCLSES
jgi:hypothetical protein